MQRHNTIRSTQRLSVIAALLLLGACSSTPVAPKMNHVEETEASHAVTFENNQTRPSAEEVNALLNFMDTVPLRSASRITLVSSDVSQMTGKRVAKVRAMLVEGGAAPSVIAEGMASGGVSELITIQVAYATAKMYGCPDWSRSSIHNYENRAFGNWSCATRTNMGRMVVDSHDLVSGKGSNTTDADRNNIAIQKYQSPAASSGAAPAASAATP